MYTSLNRDQNEFCKKRKCYLVWKTWRFQEDNDQQIFQHQYGYDFGKCWEAEVKKYSFSSRLNPIHKTTQIQNESKPEFWKSANTKYKRRLS